MKKWKGLYVISVLLLIMFVVITLIDYSKYDAVINSAPFTANIMVRAIEFVLPSIIIFVIAKFMNNRKN